MTSSEKVAYIKGLMEGLSLDENSKETKVLKAIVDVLEDIALSVADVEDEVAVIDNDVSELYEWVDEIDTDLADDGEDEMFDDDFDDDWDDEEDDLYELHCPECGKRIAVEGELLFSGEAVCPECGAEIREAGCDFDCENCDGCDPEEE